MSDHSANTDIEGIFAQARRLASGENGSSGVVVVGPDYSLIVAPPPPSSPEFAARAQAMSNLISPDVKRAVAVIARTGSVRPSADARAAIIDASRAIPFFGMLIGLSYIGHRVWIFEGSPDDLRAGCRSADLLLVDSGVLPSLAQGWEQMAADVMRNVNILVHNRQTYQLCVVRKVGTSRDQIEFLA